jgi:hypothetical protein
MLKNGKDLKSFPVAFIRISGQGLKDSKPMLDLANAIDFDKLNIALGN